MVVWVWVWAIFPLVERRSKIKVGTEEEEKEEEGGCAISLSVLVARMSAPGPLDCWRASLVLTRRELIVCAR